MPVDRGRMSRKIQFKDLPAMVGVDTGDRPLGVNSQPQRARYGYNGGSPTGKVQLLSMHGPHYVQIGPVLLLSVLPELIPHSAM